MSVENVDVLVIGAGPTGLGAATRRATLLVNLFPWII